MTIPLPGGRMLRALAQSDADELYELIERNRSHLVRWLPWAAEQSRAGTHGFIRAARAQLRRNDGFHAAIVQSGRIVGVIGFHGIDWHHRSTSIGYWLALDAQGQGTMAAALHAMVDHAFCAWQLNRVEIRASIDNARSRALIDRLGFHFEGIAREAFRLADGYHDDAVYSMLSRDWNQIKRQYAGRARAPQ